MQTTEYELNAYGAGYYDGRAFGVEKTDTQTMSDGERAMYRRGYERGVADYCLFEGEAHE